MNQQHNVLAWEEEQHEEQTSVEMTEPRLSLHVPEQKTETAITRVTGTITVSF